MAGSEAEQALAAWWEEQRVFDHGDELDGSRPRFVVDTPPPTVSGSLHLGHVFSYTHTDLMVRYRRMQGDAVLYRMGWDDNGLPTDRRVQNVFNVRCDATLPYDPGLKVERGASGDPRSISRRNYLELCDELVVDDEQKFKELWQRLALSLDWSHTYATIDEHCRRVAQWSFLDLVDKGQAYTHEAVTMWDADFQTAVAQAEVEDREHAGAMHEIRFDVEGGGGFVIGTTRPELLPACIAVMAHPDDERYKSLIGKTALTPLFAAPVPIRAHPEADPEKGTGIMMVCTFGDVADVERWREWDVPVREIVGRDGRMRSIQWGAEPYASRDAASAQRHYDELAGVRIEGARKKIVAQLRESGHLVGEPVPLQRPVRFYEKGDRPLEYVTSRQWFIRLLEHVDEFIARGREMRWHPDHFRKRYENWVNGLNQDWCVSRQRPYGVPIPVWYGADANGEADYGKLLLPSRERLPVDPTTDVPDGFEESQRGRPGGFIGDADVLDTWGTSSLTPLIVSGWPDEPERHAKLFPNTLRPHAHEIIRTWTFYSVVRAHLAFDSIPFSDVAISGFIVDPDRKKMSKSKGNVVLPTALLDEFGPDAVRYFAGSAALGVDATNDPNVFREGKRLVNKIRNAARFALGFEGDATAPEHPLDVGLLARLAKLVEDATKAWERWDHAGALRMTEAWFWSDFCENYIELVKNRAYSGDGSAIATLRIATDVVLRLFAPFLPYVCEEVWRSDRGAVLPSVVAAPSEGKQRSIHRAAWPIADDLGVDPAAGTAFGLATAVLAEIRKAKAQAQASVGAPLAKLEIVASKEFLAGLRPVFSDVVAAARAAEHDLVEDAGAEEPVIRATLA
jgi:valyl-tRNA synthetase